MKIKDLLHKNIYAFFAKKIEATYHSGEYSLSLYGDVKIAFRKFKKILSLSVIETEIEDVYSIELKELVQEEYYNDFDLCKYHLFPTEEINGIILYGSKTDHSRADVIELIIINLKSYQICIYPDCSPFNGINISVDETFLLEKKLSAELILLQGIS